MTFNKWLDTMVEEKELDIEHIARFEGDGGQYYRSPALMEVVAMGQ